MKEKLVQKSSDLPVEHKNMFHGGYDSVSYQQHFQQYFGRYRENVDSLKQLENHSSIPIYQEVQPVGSYLL